MAEQIEIYQNQAVNFTDTSNGGLPPLSRLWNFQGGSIASATGATATVFYTNAGLYNVTLTVTDSVNTSKTLTKSNLVNVSPAYIIANFTGTPTSSILMSTPINFVDASTGQPQAPNTWAWNIQGSTYSTQNVSFSGFGDWFAIGGVPGQAPGEQISVTASLVASRGALSDTEVKSFPVAKIGPVETSWVNSGGSTGPWATDSVFAVELNGSVPLVTTDIGYPGADIIYSIDLAGGTQNIQDFHVTTEDTTFYLTGCINPSPVTGLTQSSGYLIIDEAIYLSGLTQIMDGQYITTSLVNKLYFTCPILDQAYSGSYNPGYSYSLGLIDTISNSLYPQINSGQAPSYGKNFPINQAYTSTDSPVVPSPQYLTSVGASGQTYQVNVRVYFFGGASVNMIIPMIANSGVGNEIGAAGDFYVMQDTMGGTGVASILNTSFTSNVPGGLASIQAYTSPVYNTNTSGSGGPTGDYYGISLQVKSRNIRRVSITDNSVTLNNSYGLNLAPFAFNPSSPHPDTCSGMMSELVLDNYTPEFGTRLDYGGSIY